tara:strand:- start:2300 stop:2479 length:180 start_codon:yes stop_codon:yes gene_type:complete
MTKESELFDDTPMLCEVLKKIADSLHKEGWFDEMYWVREATQNLEGLYMRIKELEDNCL